MAAPNQTPSQLESVEVSQHVDVLIVRPAAGLVRQTATSRPHKPVHGPSSKDGRRFESRKLGLGCFLKLEFVWSGPSQMSSVCFHP